MKNGKRLISGNDALRILEFIQDSLNCQTEEDLRKLIDNFKEMVDYDYALCGIRNHTEFTGYAEVSTSGQMILHINDQR